MDEQELWMNKYILYKQDFSVVYRPIKNSRGQLSSLTIIVKIKLYTRIIV